MLTIRPESPDDEAAIRTVHRLAFEREEEGQLVDAIRRSPGFIPALSLVAAVDGAVVGHVLLSAIAVEDGGRSTPALALAPVAVLPAHQRQGIGSALVREALSRARELGHGIVVVVGHPDYYPRFGFQPARARGLECPFPVPDAAFMVAELRPGALDGVRGTVVYPPPFAAV